MMRQACFGPSWAQTLLSLELAKSSLENREVRTHNTLIGSWNAKAKTLYEYTVLIGK